MGKYKGWKWEDWKSFFKEILAPYVLLSPFLFTLIVFFAYAFLRSFIFSFTNYDMFRSPDFVGLRNYIQLFREELFLLALKNSFLFAFVVTFVQTAGALLLAMVMNQAIKGIRIFRTLYYMPSVMSSIVVTLIFMWMFQQQGVFNYFLTFLRDYSLIIVIFFMLFMLFQLVLGFIFATENRPFRMLNLQYFPFSLLLSFLVCYAMVKLKVFLPAENPPVDIIWLNTRINIPQFLGQWGLSRPLFSIMMLNIWTTIPTMSLLYLAGLQDIPPSLYEAADVDGADAFQKFWYITVPQVSHITFLVVTLGLIGTLQMFDQVAIVGSAAPLESTITLAYYVYNSAFPSSGVSNVGMASAAANILALLTLLVVWVQKRVQKDM